jgi:hypothetical protein
MSQQKENINKDWTLPNWYITKNQNQLKIKLQIPTPMLSS